MGLYSWLSKLWKRKERKEIYKKRLIEWRKEPSVVRVERPTRIERARSLGYKAKRGFIIARVRVRKGGRRRSRPRRGRKPSKLGMTRFAPKRSLRLIAEGRAQRKFPNLEVLNSYYLAEDGMHKWFEIIMVDPHAPEIISDRKINWILGQRKRAFRLRRAGR
jgi:large subunit ribosomal protein L15e